MENPSDKPPQLLSIPLPPQLPLLPLPHLCSFRTRCPSHHRPTPPLRRPTFQLAPILRHLRWPPLQLALPNQSRQRLPTRRPVGLPNFHPRLLRKLPTRR